MGIDAVINFETSRPLTIEELQKISYALGERFGAGSFYANNIYNGQEEEEVAFVKAGILFVRRLYEEEPHNSGWTTYTISNHDRYYGPGYERGHWPQIYAYIRFLRAYIPMITNDEVEIDVWYGGDNWESYDLVTDDLLNVHWTLFITEGREGYTGSDGSTVCPVCGGRAVCYGFRGGESMYSCHGCGWSSENSKETINEN